MPSLATVRRISRRKAFRRRFAGPSFAGGEVLPVTFPDVTLVTNVRIALGADLTASSLSWNWLDITDRVRQDLGIRIEVGRRDETGRVNAARAALKVDNTDGALTRRNPLSPYAGLLSRNTPIWIEMNPGSGFVDRFHGFINEWPTRWADQSGTDATITLQCAGIMRRLSQGQVFKSALTRSISSRTDNIAYWPLEDGTDSATAASGVAGGTVLVAGGSPSFASVQGPGGTTALLDLSDGGLLGGSIPLGPVPPVWRMQLLMKFPVGGAGNAATIISWTTPGATYQNWTLGVTAGGLMTVSEVGTSLVSVYDGLWHRIEVGNRYNSTTGDLITYLSIDSAAHAVGPISSLGVGETLARPVSITINAADAAGAHMPALGQLRFGSTDIDFEALDPLAGDDAIDGYLGEMAHERVKRLCAEENIPVVALAASSEPMGPQGTQSLLALLRECEDADGGVLSEYRFGLAYQALSERYNQSAVFALDFDAEHIIMPAPDDDDQRLRNEWTVSRPNGSAVTHRDQENVDANGLYDDGASVNVATDRQLADVAGWRVHTGTVDEDRYPALPIKLHGSPDLIPSWLATTLGSRITIDNPPPQLHPGQIDLIVEGWGERWDDVSWDVALSTSPASPFRVGVYGVAPTVSRYDSANSFLAAAYSDSDTTLSVVTDAGHACWVTTAAFPDYFPPNGPGFDINVEGIRLTVTDITSTTSPQTFTVTRSVDGYDKALSSGAQVRLWIPARYAL